MTGFLTTIFFLTFLYTGVAIAIEEPKYTIESQSDHYEIRKDDATLVADYIFGNNKAKTKM